MKSYNMARPLAQQPMILSDPEWPFYVGYRALSLCSWASCSLSTDWWYRL